ncbi:hypothetical protein [Methylobacterium nodulans]|uniref:Uncharacterized protein n=1 Tax=Methylobacterium nodulans (strain LMG 21967 / CNCM I-2342 / ORS 2060) TaxID=460265 RepID=B8ICF8_METNO|nr:hypothetical protein [Methylobacterium nodulans]ACL55546.1 hypothetical protein Mnod_0505 [Methylobacterium nodulans ORS 2060]
MDLLLLFIAAVPAAILGLALLGWHAHKTRRPPADGVIHRSRGYLL